MQNLRLAAAGLSLGWRAATVCCHCSLRMVFLTFHHVTFKSQSGLFLCSDVGFGSAGSATYRHHTVKYHQVSLRPSAAKSSPALPGKWLWRSSSEESVLLPLLSPLHSICNHGRITIYHLRVIYYKCYFSKSADVSSTTCSQSIRSKSSCSAVKYV